MIQKDSKIVLVTGCAGFIASEVCNQLLKAGFTVVGVDNLNAYYDVRLKQNRLNRLTSNPNFCFLPIDVENREALDQIFSKYTFSIIYHLAARAGVRYSLANPYVYYTTNVLGTLNILELMRKHGTKKIVLASTSSIYAGQPYPFVEDLAVNEPISPYAATKKSAELLCYSYHHLFKLDVSVVRYFTVYGPWGRPDMSVFRFFRWISDGQEIEMYGDGSQTRDFTFVEDIARGTILAGETEVGYQIINLGGGQRPVSLNEMIALMEKMVGKKAKVKHLPFHPADLTTTSANIEKAQRILGWKPLTSFEQGLNQTWDSFKSNPIMFDILLDTSK